MKNFALILLILAAHTLGHAETPKEEISIPELFHPEIQFCNTTTHFNTNNAYWLALAATASYESDFTVRDYEKNFEEFKISTAQVEKSANPFTNSLGVKTEILFAESNQDLIIAIRGSEPDDILDLINDFSIRKISWKGIGRVHIGFSQFFESLRPHIEPKLLSLKNKNIWITGHSLGGAGATLLYAHLALLQQKGQFQNIKLMPLYTFGSPRIGDATLAKWFSNHSQTYPAYRVRNYEDPVSLVPITRNILFGKYQHVGKLMYFSEYGDLHLNMDENKIPKNWIDLPLKDFLGGARYHFITSYVKNLLRIAKYNLDCPIF